MKRRSTFIIRLMCGHFRYFSKKPPIGAHRCYTCGVTEYEDIAFSPLNERKKYGVVRG